MMTEEMPPAEPRKRKVGRPPKFQIDPGMKLGRWTIIERSVAKRASWVCRCDCGTVRDVKCTYLANGDSRSCGCLRIELLYSGNSVSNRKMKKREYHGGRYSAEYRIWCGMIQRCENENAPSYGYYGEEGVTVCKEWRESFAAFLASMGPRPSPDHSIERLDETRGYELGNCLWATRETQMNHRRNCVTLTARGQTLTIAQWARRTGLSRSTIMHRLLSGKVGEDALKQVRPGWIARRSANEKASANE